MKDPTQNLETSLEARLKTLRADLDERATRDESFWQEQRRAIRRARPETSSNRPARLRHAWALTAVAALLLVSLVLGHWVLAPPGLDLPTGTGTDTDTGTLDTSTAELLRSVEITLAADAAPALSAGDLLLAELEQQYLEQASHSP